MLCQFMDEVANHLARLNGVKDPSNDSKTQRIADKLTRKYGDLYIKYQFMDNEELNEAYQYFLENMDFCNINS